MPFAFIAIGVAVVAVVLWMAALSKSKSLSSRVASLLVDNAALHEQQKQLAEQQRKTQAVFDKRSEEVLELRKDVAALKKKNFTLQEESKKSKTSFEAKIEEREKLLTQRPAFEAAPVEKAKPVAAPVAAPVEARPAPVTAEADESARRAESELSRRVESLARENAALSAKVAELSNAMRDGSGEMRRMKKRIDDYRRADNVTKSKLDVLNDKLGTMGRRYYDAVSELAQLKGEVAPTRGTLGIEATQSADAPFEKASTDDESSQAGQSN